MAKKGEVPAVERRMGSRFRTARLTERKASVNR